jgi:hypothetical protein
MSGFRSSNGYLGFARQGTEGTGVAPTTFLRLSTAESLEQVQDILEVRSLYADREIDAIYKTAHKPGGSFQTYARPFLGAELLAYCLGNDSVSANAVVTHTITKGNTIPWISIERQLDNVERFIDCKINQIVINGASGQPVTMEVSFMACDSAIQGSAATDVYETDEPFMFYDGTYTLDSGAITKITAFTITINNNLELIQTTSYKTDDILEGPFDVKIAMTLKFEASETLYPAVYFGGSTALTDVLDTGNFTVDLNYGSGASARELKFAMPQLIHTAVTGKNLDPVTKAVYLNLSSTAVKGASEIITVTAKNTETGDYLSTSPSVSPSSSISPSLSPSASVSPSISPSSSSSVSPSPSG